MKLPWSSFSEMSGPPLDPPLTIFCTPIISIRSSLKRAPTPANRARPTDERRWPPGPDKYYCKHQTSKHTDLSSSRVFMCGFKSSAFGNPIVARTLPCSNSRTRRLGNILYQRFHKFHTSVVPVTLYSLMK